MRKKTYNVSSTGGFIAAAFGMIALAALVYGAIIAVVITAAVLTLRALGVHVG
jgi:hypothetical protein